MIFVAIDWIYGQSIDCFELKTSLELNFSTSTTVIGEDFRVTDSVLQNFLFLLLPGLKVYN